MKKIVMFLLVLAGFLLTSQEAGAQLARRVFGTANNETNAFVLNINGSEHFVINSVNTGTGDIQVSRYNSSTGAVVWRQTYGNSLRNEQTVSCMLDASGNLVLLINDLTNNRFAIMQIDAATTTLNYYRDYALGVNTLRGVKIAVGTHNNNYFVISNQLNGANFDVCHFLEIAPATGLIVYQREFDNGEIGFYDFGQINANQWVIVGSQLNGDYHSIVFIFDRSNGTVPIGTRFIHDINAGDHDAYDRVIVDAAHNRVYLGYHVHRNTNQQIDVGVRCMNLTLSTTNWSREYSTTTSGHSERLSSMVYDAANDRLYLSGYNQVNTEYGFITCLTGQTGLRQWTKYPSGMTVSIPTGTPFRIDLQQSQVLYASDYDNGSDRDILWGSEGLASFTSRCFVTKNYDEISATPSAPLTVTPSTPAFTSPLATQTDATLTLTDGADCSLCDISLGDFIVLSDATLTQNTFWGTQSAGIKYFIQGTLTVNSGVTLDATNVDVVFDVNAEIVLQAGATLRANNSVFRPCDLSTTWNRIRFNGNPEGAINNCIFKNANFALDLGGTTSNLKITNNQFSNCLVGVRWQTTINNLGSITGNKFFVDNTNLWFPVNNPSYNSATHYTGILLNETAGELIVSQNEFIYARSAGPAKRLYGIFAFASEVTITENTFTNCFRALDIMEPGIMNIENNEVEITRENYTNDYQVMVAGFATSNPVKISNNRINNFNVAPDPAQNQAAVYVDRTQFFEVSDNLINGFKTGIQLIDVLDGKVYSNHIIGSSLFGIYAEDCENTSIRCNEIDMKFNIVEASMCAGIRYYETRGIENTVEIRGNCIFNTYDAMVLSAASSGFPIPIIKNNYLYNYYHSGILNLGFTGTIGTGPTAPDAGRNVFISNNLNGVNGAYDIYSTQPVTEDGNYNVLTINGMVAPGSFSSSYSTASCGHFFTNTATARIEIEDKCDHPYSDGSTLIDYEWGDIIDGGGGNGDGFVIKDDYSRLTYWAKAAKALSNNGKELAELETAITTVEKNPDVKVLYDAYVLVLKGQYQQAGSALQGVLPADQKLAKTKDRLLLLSKMAGQGTDVSLAIKKEIAGLVNENDYFAVELRGGLNPWDEGFEYVFASVRPYSGPQPDEKRLVTNEMLLTVYPNPASGNEVMVDIVTPGHAETVLYVRDILGKIVYTQSIDFAAGSATVSTQSLPNGVYFISLESDEEVLKTEKLFITH